MLPLKIGGIEEYSAEIDEGYLKEWPECRITTQHNAGCGGGACPSELQPERLRSPNVGRRLRISEGTA